MLTERRSRKLVGLAAAAVAVLIVTAMLAAEAGAKHETLDSARRTASVALLTTRDFRVAVVAIRLNGGASPTAEARVAVAQRVGASWRESGERRLDETYFWRTVSGPRAVCRLEVMTAGSQPSFRPHVTVQLLLSPSLGCGRTYRLPLATR
jgi:hypothetical protein